MSKIKNVFRKYKLRLSVYSFSWWLQSKIMVLSFCEFATVLILVIIC